MRRLFNKEFGDYQNFYNDILEPLFYEALRTDRSSADHYYSRFNCKIPFLNGGLFDPINNFDWVNVDILLPDELFSNQNRTKEGDIGDGILDIFDRYNFTVNEEEPLEKEVALDPELLGKIYEKLNAIRPNNFDGYIRVLKSGKKGEEIKFNKEYGVYYTPREIVHYMCKESLINYLFNELNKKGSSIYEKLDEKQLYMVQPVDKSKQYPLVIDHLSISSFSREDIEKFVELSDSVQEREIVALEREEKIRSEQQKTTRYESQIPESIRQNAQKIDDLLANIKVCDPAVGSGAFPIGMMHEIVKLRSLLSVYLKREINIYDLKCHCIENSLYGVDIDSGAVEICKLRFWLSMIVDEEDFYNIKPLPNLDYKVVCGDSLLSVEKDLFNQKVFKKLEELKLQYFHETNPVKKRQLKNEIDELIYEITEGHKEFDFEVYFSEIFHQKGGFDVVIANPPYSSILQNREKLINSYRFYDKRKNSASFFIERGRIISKSGGIVAFIVPKSLSFSEGWARTRDFILTHNKLLAIIDVSEAFEEVLLEQIIIIFKNQKDEISYGFKTGEGWSKNIKNIGVVSSDLAKQVEILPIYIDAVKMALLEKIKKNSVPLKGISETFRGLPLQKRCSKTGSHPIIRGCNIGKFLIYGDIYKVVLKNNELKNKKVRKILSPKIISQNIVAHVKTPKDRIIIMATYDKEGLLTMDTVMNTFITNKIFSYEYVLAILNSRLAEWFYYWFVYNRAVRTMHFDRNYMGKLPIPLIPSQKQHIVHQIEFLVSQILQIKKQKRCSANTSELEAQIDQLVYKLYDLTDEEIKIIEGLK